MVAVVVGGITVIILSGRFAHRKSGMREEALLIPLPPGPNP